MKAIGGLPSNSNKHYKMAAQALTTDKFARNDEFHLNLIKMEAKFYVWEDKGLVYECDDGVMKPLNLDGFIAILNVVSKDFAKKYVELPDKIPQTHYKKHTYRKSDIGFCKHAFMKYCWENCCSNHKPTKKEAKKVKKGKKNRGKR